MSSFEKFKYKSIEDLQQKITDLGLNIGLLDDFSVLAQRPKVGEFILPNSLVINPMEGCDGETDGSPSDLTVRRYKRFARGGAGLLWFEATAVASEGRANPRQLYINKANVDSFKAMAKEAISEAKDSMGSDHRPLLIMQLTHSGRYSKPQGLPDPVIAYHDPNLDSRAGVSADQELISDAELDQLQEQYVEAAVLAEKAGLDGVDIKCCHRYLLSELLAAHTRKGKYGGSFENRTRFLLETIEKIRAKVGETFIIGVRMNVFDALPYPYGWGVNQDDYMKPDLTEPKQLAKLLVNGGVSIINVSAGNPYYVDPQVGRPFDVPVIGADKPKEHPLINVDRLFTLAEEIQTAVPNTPVVGTGYSWLREYLGYAAATNIAKGAVTLAGVGREAFAYPDFAKDLLQKGSLDKRKVCIACSKCTQIMRDGGKAGCVIRDSQVYLPIYKEGRNS